MSTSLVPHTYVESTTSIGGSDVAAIIGCNQYKSIHDVWNRFCRPDLVVPRKDNPAMEQGRHMEPLIVSKYAEFSGNECVPYGRVIHPKYPFMHATLDGAIIKGARAEGESIDTAGYGVIEAKSFGLGNFKKVEAFGLEGIDDMYHAQGQDYLMVTGWSWGVFSAFGREKWKLIPMEFERDEVLISKIEERCVSFWNDYVLTGKRPPEEEFKVAFPRAPEAKVERYTEGRMVELFAQFKSVRENKDLYEAQEEGLIEEMKEILGTTTHATIPGIGKISWSESSQRRLDGNALKAAHPEIDYSEFTKVIQMRPFRPTFSAK